MNAIINQQAKEKPLRCTVDPYIRHHDNDAVNTLSEINPISPILLPASIPVHHPNAGLNPVVDAAGHLFSVLNKLQRAITYPQLNSLQTELMQEINAFQETVKSHGYSTEFILVCRYVICAAFDEIIGMTAWGNRGQWKTYSLLAAFNHDIQHKDRFFSIMEQAIKKPDLYIDLMELMYICLSMGYKGPYRMTEHNLNQLNQITNNLYKHIQAYRGGFSKILSPAPVKTSKPSKPDGQNKITPAFIFLLTACIILMIFISLDYLMDGISNEAYQPISQSEPLSHKVTKQQ